MLSSMSEEAKNSEPPNVSSKATSAFPAMSLMKLLVNLIWQAASTMQSAFVLWRALSRLRSLSVRLICNTGPLALLLEPPVSVYEGEVEDPVLCSLRPVKFAEDTLMDSEKEMVRVPLVKSISLKVISLGSLKSSKNPVTFSGESALI